jgi:ankyrin repeat protein
MVMWVDHEPVLPVLLSAGLPIDAQDNIGRTPHYVAVMNGASPDLIRRLLDLGADPHAETVHGASPSHVARSRSAQRENLRFLWDV